MDKGLMPVTASALIPISMIGVSPSDEPILFPLFEGGPFLRLEKALRLADPGRASLRRNILAAIGLTWLPLVVLSAVQGLAIGLDWRHSMLLDPAMHARYLVAIPLLIVAAPNLQRIFQTVVHHFLEAGLVKAEDRLRFFANVEAMLRWRDSWVAMAIWMGIAVALVALSGAESLVTIPDSWRMVANPGHRAFTLAGWWWVLVSETVYTLVVLRFLYRLVLWWRFLWQTSRLDLRLNAAHPDSAGGLGFLPIIFRPFQLPLFAISTSVAGGVANLIIWTGWPIVPFQYGVATLAALLIALVVGPLFFFSPQLMKAKERAVLACGTLGGRQLRAFEEKWFGAPRPAPEEALRAPDFSAVGGFIPTVTTVHKMSLLPFWPKQLVPLVVVTLLPFLPVAAAEMPLKEILMLILKVLN